MKRVIRFQRTRYYFFAFSASMFIVGALFYFLRGGFNLGVDFKAGIALQFQVAPASFSIQYTGPGKAEVTIPAGEQALTAAGDFIITITAPDGGKQSAPFRYADYATVQALANAVDAVADIAVQIKGEVAAPPSSLVPLTRPADITGKPFTINISPEPGAGVQAPMADVRSTLSSLGQFDLQVVGRPVNQEFIARMEAKTEDPEFQTRTEAAVLKLLGDKYGADQVILKRTDFVGPRLSGSLARQSVWLILVALVLIQIYMAFRFKLVYAVAAVLALVHDAVVMLAFFAVFRVELDAGTIAAILTILGYSINDTIVIFDRVRENQPLMRGASLETLLDTSVTQTLGRTIITSGATFLTVLSLFLLTSGTMKNFALAMIVGIVEGSYSTVFIASPIVLEWENMRNRRKKVREREKYGFGTGEAGRVEKASEAVREAAQEEPEEEVPLQAGFEVTGVSETEGAQEAGVADGVEPAAGIVADGAAPVGAGAAAGAPAAGAAPSGNVIAFPGGPAGQGGQRGATGSRKHKKHRRGH
jgi:preprotein translocase subunit SecF